MSSVTALFTMDELMVTFGSVWTYVFIVFILLLVTGLAIQLRRYIKRTESLEAELETWYNDELTSLLSRRMWFFLATRLFNQVKGALSSPTDEDRRHSGSNAYSGPLTFLFIDIDHFKRVNDTHGHAIGDKVLAALGRIICKHVRGDDLAGRFGGEEIVVALCSDIFGAQAFIRRIREELTRTKFENERGETFDITISTGMVQLTNPNETMQGMITAADALLYKAKGNGRNRYIMQEASGTTEHTD